MQSRVDIVNIDKVYIDTGKVEMNELKEESLWNVAQRKERKVFKGI